MIILIEGVDGSGKTTLIEKLVPKLEKIKDVKIVPTKELAKATLLGPDRFSEQQLKARMFQMITETSTIYICDRGPLSDIVYRTFDEHQPVINLSSLLSFWMRFQWLFTVIGCDSDKAEALMKARGETNKVAHQYHKEIRYLYQQLFPIFAEITYDIAKDCDVIEDYKVGDEILDNIEKLVRKKLNQRQYYFDISKRK